MKQLVGTIMALMLVTQICRGDDDTPDAPIGPVTASVQTAAVQHRMVSKTVVAYGQVAADTRQLFNVNVPHAGQIVSLKVRVGQRVKKGDTLLDFVTAPESIQAWRQASTALAYARAERKRVAQLVVQQLATASQLAAADHAVADAEAALAAQRALGTDQGRVEVRAPFDGRVQSVPVSVGDRTAAAATLMQLSSVAGQRVLLALDVADSDGVHAGLAVHVASLVTDEPAYEGRIDQVADSVVTQTQQIEVTVQVAGVTLRPGERVRGDIRMNPHMADMVPRSAVLKDESGAYIYQVRAGKAWRITVQPGIASGNWVAISGRLLADAPVVVTGNYELQNAMLVHAEAWLKSAP